MNYEDAMKYIEVKSEGGGSDDDSDGNDSHVIMSLSTNIL